MPTSDESVTDLDVEPVRRAVAEILQNDIPADGSFINHGGDSYRAVLVVAHVEEEYGVELDFVDVLTSTPQQLTAAIARLAPHSIVAQGTAHR